MPERALAAESDNMITQSEKTAQICTTINQRLGTEIPVITASEIIVSAPFVWLQTV